MQSSILSERSNITNTDLSAIRNLFPKTDVITMTYQWLVGVAMTMDSRGIVKRYNYDEFEKNKIIYIQLKITSFIWILMGIILITLAI